MKRVFSLSKSKRLLIECYARFQKSRLSDAKRERYAPLFKQLKKAVIKRRRQEASELAQELVKVSQKHFPKSWLSSLIELITAIAFALIFATIVRQMWFEPMEIPTGSMRPTLQEQDHLIVDKTSFGLNVPLMPRHFQFEPASILHGSIIVFTVENLPLLDAKTKYFYLFPGYKRFVKRCMGKSGDILYFYGGKIYGVDKDGNPLAMHDLPALKDLCYVPFISFEGKEIVARNQYIDIHQMNQQLARIDLQSNPFLSASYNGQILVNGEWVNDSVKAALQPHELPVTYSDFWGIGNYAGARLLTKRQLPADAPALDSGELYLELRHHPTLEGAQVVETRLGTPHAIVKTFTTYLPLQPRHIKALFNALYTSRFYIRDGKALLYSEAGPRPSPYAPVFQDIPEGRYEFYDGVAYHVGFGGVLHPLPYSHPFYEKTPAMLQKLFNCGIEWNTLMMPRSNLNYYPSRFAFFRDGSLYVMDHKIFDAEDPLLQEFVANEIDRQNRSQTNPYLAFIDRSPPIKEGLIDQDFLNAFGLKIPDGFYLALGDNYAMSGDSRDFGFVPQGNLEGSPLFLLWPPGQRWGVVSQPKMKGFHASHYIVFALAAASLTIWIAYKRREFRKIPG